MTETFRVVAWNLMQGGGPRRRKIVDQLVAWEADVAVLSEYRASNSEDLREMLADAGLSHLAEGPDPVGKHGGILVASRYKLTDGGSAIDCPHAHRWQHLTVADLGWDVVASYIPTASGTGPEKQAYWNEMLRVEGELRARPTIITGDFNTGKHLVDEAGSTFIGNVQFEEMLARGWADGFRALHGDEQAWSWWSPQAGNGFRLDHAFLSPESPTPVACSYETEWNGVVICGRQKPKLSDHAAMITTLPVIR